MRLPDGSLISGWLVLGMVILFGLGVIFAFEEEFGLMFLFIILAWVWIAVGQSIVGDGGMSAQIEKDRTERARKEERGRADWARMQREQERILRKQTENEAYAKEEDLDYAGALRIWESLGNRSEAKRIRLKMREEEKVKVDQTVVHGDYVDDRDTIVKDSVISRSNIGAGGKSKSEELRDAKALLDDGIIDDDEFKQMKKEILGK